jgi:hypothetical protein
MKAFLVFIFIFSCFSIKAQELEYFSTSKLDKKISESSGVVTATDSTFYTINDSGNKSILYEVNKQGTIKREIKIESKNLDWEDLAKDEEGNVYIGDIGNNVNSRKDLRILKLSKEDLSSATIKPEVFNFKYEDQTQFPPERHQLYYDCEALIIKNNKALMLTKNRTDPFDGVALIYELPLDGSSKKAQLLSRLNLCKDGWYPCSITSADFDSKSNTLYLLTYTSVIRMKNFNFKTPSESKQETIIVNKIEQFEAICIGKNGHLILTSEAHRFLGGGNIHKTKIND